MDRSKIQFSFESSKGKASGLTDNDNCSSTLEHQLENHAASTSKASDKVSLHESTNDLLKSSLSSSTTHPENPKPNLKLKKQSSSLHISLEQRGTSHASTSLKKNQKESHNMGEPPAKRVKRTDSSAMWEHNTSRSNDIENKPRPTSDTIARERPDNKNRRHAREERHHKSRSRDRTEKRRERSRSRERERDRDRKRDRDRERDGGRKKSRSREREGGKHRNGDRGDDRVKKDRKRSRSRERQRSRRDEFPPRRTDRQRSRSRSPSHPKTSATRTRSRPRPLPSNPEVTKPTEKSTPVKSPSPPPNKPSLNQEKPSSALPPPTLSAPTPARNGTSTSTASTSPTAKTKSNKPSTKPTPPADPTPMEVDSDPEVTLMRQMMGFVNFKSTKNKKVPGNNVYGVRKEKKTEYRQYMNRVGGFNRPLSPSR